MRSGTIAFLLGVCLAARVHGLPDPFVVEFLPLAVFLAVWQRSSRWPLLVCCGFLWAVWIAQLSLREPFPRQLEGATLLAEGVVASIPSREGDRLRMVWALERIIGAGNDRAPVQWRGLVRLSWYQAPLVRMHVGERWRFTVRLRRPHGLMNPGGFDYEGWLFSRGLQALGYVREGDDNVRVANTRRFAVDRLRDAIHARLARVLGADRNLGVINALTIGHRDDISRAQWSALRDTGTSHLMAISGLHIGLVAALGFVLVRHLWTLYPRALLALAAPRAGAIGALVFAAAYAGLSGFSVPTERALIMSWALMSGLFMRRCLSSGHTLALAMAGVLLIDPFSVVSAGFWLSFTAVAVILYAMHSTVIGAPGQVGRLWWRWGRVQWLVAVGLAPLTLLLFDRQPLLSPIANLVVVPWVGLLVVPLALTGVVLSFVSQSAAGVMLGAVSQALELVWPFLSALSSLDLAYEIPARAPAWATAVAFAGVVVLLAPRGVPARWLGAVLMLPAVLWPPAVGPPAGGLALMVLDVGQGLSVIARTRTKTLIYDTGARFGAHFDAGEAVVVPYLRHLGVRRVDTLIVSHRHHDHTGGLQSIRKQMPVGRVLSNVTALASSSARCVAGDRWRWDGVDFEILHPPAGQAGDGNNESCVLLMRSEAGTVLLPGDIEKETEKQLIDVYGALLDVDILLVPHHGSTTSSTAAFVAVTSPAYAVFATGYLNRFRFPARRIVERYEAAGARVRDTTRDGAIAFTLVPGEPLGTPRLERLAAGRLWTHHP